MSSADSVAAGATLSRRSVIGVDGWRGLALAAAVVGIVMRWWLLHTPLGLLDGDEAIAGLMARHVFDGDVNAFFWGQQYGGTLEPLLTAPLFAVFGSSPFLLKLVPIALHAASAFVIWRIGLRLADRKAAIVAASLWWCWPGAYVWWSTKSRGFYQATLLLSLLTVLLSLRLAREPSRKIDWLLLGGVVGIGWWQSPQIALIAAPALAWLLAVLIVRHRGTWIAGLLPAAMGFALGASPWIAFNIRNPWLSLRSDFAERHGSYLDHLHALATRGMPMVIGVKQLYTEHWIGSKGFGVLVTVVVLALAAVGIALLRPRWDTPGGLLVALVVAFPIVYAAFPNGLNVAEGRYQVFAAPMVCLGLGAVVARARFGVTTAPILVALSIVLALAGLHSSYDLTRPYVAGGVAVPWHVKPLIDALTDEGNPAVYTDYWVAGPLRFQSRERIEAASVNFFRDGAMQARVDSAPAVAWVYVAGANDRPRLDCAASRMGITLRSRTAGGFEIVVPSAAIRPGDLTGC
ncbi:MAG: glycosyltransferase family 39 protein [Acidimicrobiia bacterium]